MGKCPKYRYKSMGGVTNACIRAYLEFLLVDISDIHDAAVLFHDEEQTGI